MLGSISVKIFRATNACQSWTKDVQGASCHYSLKKGRSNSAFTFWVLSLMLAGASSLVPVDGPCPHGCSCIEHVLECTIANSSVTWLVFLKHLPENTVSLTVNKTFIPNLVLPDEHSIPTFKKMTYLAIAHCNIFLVGPNAFMVFPHLIELHLVSDGIQKLDDDAFRSLSSLKLLNVSQNMLTRIQENIFQGMHNLQVLDLAYNRIEFVDNVFNSTGQLQVLNLTNNMVNYIHPTTFRNLQELHTVHLNYNRLEALHSDIFTNLSSLRHVSIDNNSWSCDCSMKWLYEDRNQSHTLLHSLKTGIQCKSPPEYNSMYLDVLLPSNLTCTFPEITNKLMDVVFLRLETTVLECMAQGFPRPSLYWITPHGVLAAQHNQMWMSLNTVDIWKHTEFFSMPKHHKSNIVAFENGSLAIRRIRPFLTGKYTCVAENPAGAVFLSMNVAITTTFHRNMCASMVVGSVMAACFLLVSIIYASIRTGIYQWLKQRHLRKLALREVQAKADKEASLSLKQSPVSSCSDCSRRDWTPIYISPYESPMKCTTPVDADVDPDSIECQLQRANIRETLEDVRFRLRSGMERSVTKLRSGAQQVSESSRQYIHSMCESSNHYMQNMRESSNHYMQNIRESGSHTIHNLRSSGSQAANKVRAGMVLSVEQVKYHVQSMRELCLTGSIGQTISTISVATDVDSQVRTDVVKKITYV